jgi:hypothetical protein
MNKDFEKIKSILLQLPNVVAVGRTAHGIECSVTQKLPESALSIDDVIPKHMDGERTDVVETGIIRALVRPAPGGVSVGHVDVTAGTLGMWVTGTDGYSYILSNNHVIADCNDANLGDAIIQPGYYDGGRYPKDHIANLTKYIHIHFLGEETDCGFSKAVAYTLNGMWKATGRKTRFKAVVPHADVNFVDAALALALNEGDTLHEIMNVGKVTGTIEATLGRQVQKVGRTTGHTTGTISQVDVTVQVTYGGGRMGVFTDQIAVKADGEQFSAPGDSGSIILEGANACGLLFAGSDTVTFANRIQNVESALGIYI